MISAASRAVAFCLAVAACGGRFDAEPVAALPAECIPPALAEADCVRYPDGWGLCAGPDGSRWVFFPPEQYEGGWQHETADSCNICRVWGNGAYATWEQTGQPCAEPVAR